MSGHCLCRTIQWESTRIWNDLQDAETLKSPIHEDTITQTLALTLNRQHGGQNRVHIFGGTTEGQNGSDFLWLFFSADHSRHFRVAVQAKRLYPDGRYSAFKASQAQSIIKYASSIFAYPIYVFYNFARFRSGYYAARGANMRYFPRRGLDHPRDFGAIYVPADKLLSTSDGQLMPQDVAAGLLPLWHPFCYCDNPTQPSPLDELAERFTRSGYKGHLDVPGCRETDAALGRWMGGEGMDDRQLEEVLLVGSEAPSDGFAPSFVVGTRLRNWDLAE